MTNTPESKTPDTKEITSTDDRVKRLENMVCDLYVICESLWGGEGTWQRCWDNLHKHVKDIKELNRDG